MAYPHVPIDEQLQRIRAANDRNPKPRNITILGAGIAGLVAAYELRKLGHSVTIYEASDRIGGRIFTYRFGAESDGLYGELGAMRIPASHDYTRYYISEFKLKTRKFITVLENGDAFLDFRGKVARIKDGQAAVYPLYQLSDWERTQYPGAAIFGRHLESLIGLMTPNEQAALFNGLDSTGTLQYLDDISLGDFLRQRGQAADSMELMGSFTSLEGWLDMSVTMFLRDTIVDTSDGLEEIVGGSDLLPRAVAATMDNCIHKQTIVHGIAAGNDGVKLHVAKENIAAEQVLTTIPFSVMRRMDLAGFSDEKLTSIRSLNYAAATKVILNMKERFWETKYGIFGGASISDRMTRQTYYPSDHSDASSEQPAAGAPRGVAGIAMRHRRVMQSAAHEAGGPGVLLASYTLGQDATRMAALDQHERARVSMKEISRFHPEIEDPGMVLGSASMAWSTYPWSAGAFSFLWPRQLGGLYQAAIRNENRVYFAGEHCSTDQAWIQGALISALRAVEEMVSAP